VVDPAAPDKHEEHSRARYSERPHLARRYTRRLAHWAALRKEGR